MTRPAATARPRDSLLLSPPPPIRLMIVDDSPVARAVLSRMLAGHRDFETVAIAANAGEAIDALKAVKVDIVLLDVEMPGTTGLDALPDILRLGDGARVLVVSSLCEEGAEATVRALGLGAADTLPKPGAGNFAGRFSEVLAERLRRIGRAGGLEADAVGNRAVAVHLRAAPADPPGCIAIGASTGGLHAISQLLRGLAPEVGAPILVTQHLPPVFMPYFARQLAGASGRVVRVAEDGMIPAANEILLAPGDGHLALARKGGRVRVQLSREPAASGCLPSVDAMLRSAADIYGPAALGVVLSGMGRDGLEGARQIVARGGAVLVQNRTSSAVWGMPRAIAESGLASAMLAPAGLADRIMQRVEIGAEPEGPSCR